MYRRRGDRTRGLGAESWSLVEAPVGQLLAVLASGLALYVVLPSLARVASAWPRLVDLNPVWLAVSFLAECVSFTCAFALQRLVLRTGGWFAVVTAGLAGNAVTDILPAGDAAGSRRAISMLTGPASTATLPVPASEPSHSSGWADSSHSPC